MKVAHGTLTMYRTTYQTEIKKKKRLHHKQFKKYECSMLPNTATNCNTILGFVFRITTVQNRPIRTEVFICKRYAHTPDRPSDNRLLKPRFYRRSSGGAGGGGGETVFLSIAASTIFTLQERI